jgi:hypothetical protein
MSSRRTNQYTVTLKYHTDNYSIQIVVFELTPVSLDVDTNTLEEHTASI